jgi:uncharacterized protein (DUF302 family)
MARRLALVLIGWLCLASWGGAQSVVEVEANGSFDEIRQLLIVAIENQGLVVDHQSKVGEMLERTGRDLGESRTIYRQAEVLQFCSANYSRQMMEADVRLLAFCPFGIGLYTLPGETGRVHLVYRRVEAQGVSDEAAQALRKIDEILGAIAREAGE